MEVNKSFTFPPCYPDAYFIGGLVVPKIGEKLLANSKVPSLSNIRNPVVQFVAIQ